MPIMKEKLIIVIAGKCFPQLLECPLSRRMAGHIEVNEPSRSDFECDKHIEDTKACCYGNKESRRLRCRGRDCGERRTIADPWVHEGRALV